MSGEFQFANPSWLFLTIVLVAVTLWSIRQNRRAAVTYSSTRLLQNLPLTWAQRLKRWLPWLRCLAMAMMIIALARPQWGLSEFRVRTEGIAIVMCLDRSGSMLAMDFQLDDKRVNRLAACKDVFRRFVVGDGGLAGRPDDLIGLVAFGGFAEAKSPLTLDHGALLEVMETVEVAQAVRSPDGRVLNEQLLQEEQATAIGDALTLGVDRLKDQTSDSKVIILLSDGENTAGITDPAAAAQTAKEFGIKVYSIGVGSTGVAPFPMVDAFGRQRLVRQRVRLDEDTLKQIASTTGGRYFAARDTEALMQVYEEIDQLEKTKTEGRVYTQYRELFRWLLLPGIGLIVLESVLRWTRFRELP